MKNPISFGSDNNAGVHPDILHAINIANAGQVPAYGDDYYTEQAIAKFKEHFGNTVDVFFVFNGTAANVLGLKAITQSYHAIICAETAHINVDECGAPEQFIGCKLLPIATPDGKLTPKLIEPYLHGFGDQHHVQPRVISVSQTTELGTLYTLDELRALADFAHAHQLLFHIDGARLANAAANLNTTMKNLTVDIGTDVFSFGGTKNGMLYGEAVVFCNPSFAHDFKYIRKQGMQLGSKMRFIAAQFSALLSDNLWHKNAKHANEMAQLLAKEIHAIPQIQITRAVQANAVFATVPAKIISLLQQRYFFYVWNSATSEVRWMTSFITQANDVTQFVHFIKETINHAS